MDDVKLQLQALLPASIRNRPWVDDMGLRQHDLPGRSILFRADTNPQRLYFLANGWAIGSTALSKDRRPISSLSIRGDVIGLNWINHPNHMEEVSTITPCELISVPIDRFRDWMRRDPLLQSFVLNEIIREMMNLRMLGAVIGHLKAPDRLAYFLFIMLNRCRRTYQTSMMTLPVPMTQEEIGRILGLTNVSVNRAFRALEADRIIQSGRNSVTFLDEKRLIERFDLEHRTVLIDQLVGGQLEGSRAA